jgi:hypothetical protein
VPSTTTANAVKLSLPSESAKMLCEAEVRHEIAETLGVKATRVAATWDEKRHLYSCTYFYSSGKVVMSVEELAGSRDTTARVELVRKRFGTKQALGDISDGMRGWLLGNDNVVARKDDKVLLVDVQGIPANFGPGLPRSSVAISTAIALCWTDF